MPVTFPAIPEHVRAYLYRVLTALSVAAIGFGLITDEKAALILPVIAAVLGNGLATANTSVKNPEAGQSILVVALVAAAVCVVLLLALDVITVR